MRNSTSIALSYAVFGAAWILLSDLLVFTSLTEMSSARWMGTVKGLIFVTLSALLIGYLTRRWERALRKRLDLESAERARYKRTLNSLDEAVFLIRGDTRLIEDCNQAVTGIFGYDPEELIGTSTERLHMNPDAFRSFAQASEPVLARGGVFEAEFEMRRRDGTPFSSSHTVSLLRPEEGLEMGVVSVVRDITERRRAEQQLRDFYDHLHGAREQERARIAGEIHDDIGQALTGMKIDLHQLRGFESPKEVGTRLRDLEELVDSTAQSLRALATELHPGVLEQLGLIAAVEWLADQNRSRFEEGVSFQASVDDFDLDPKRAVHAFRIVQEAISNAIRHSGARSLQIEVAEDEGRLCLCVVDDGQWKEGPSESPTLGLTGMRERARLIDAVLRIDTSDEGTRVDLVLANAGGAT